MRYIVKTTQKLRYIDDIFEKEEGKEYYINDALLLQDFLQYSLEINQIPLRIDTRFKKRELQNWIVRKNKEIVEYYDRTLNRKKTTYSNRIHARERRLNDYFEILLDMNLIKAVGIASAEKVALPVNLYRYTYGGILLALIAKSIDLKQVIIITKGRDIINKHQNELDRIHQSIFEIFQLAFKITKSSPARDIFYSCLIQQSLEKGILDNLISRIQETIYSDIHIINVTDLLQRSFYSSSFEGSSKIEFLDVFWETIKNLDRGTKRLILFQIKVVAESRFENRQENISREYEEYRFKLRSDYKRIAIEGYCKNCRHKQVIGIHYLDIKRISAARADATNWTCPSCSTKESLAISGFLY